MPRIEDLKEAHAGEWLVIRVTRKEEHVPVEGELLFHSEDREVVADWVAEIEETLYVTYAGPPIPEGTGAAF